MADEQHSDDSPGPDEAPEPATRRPPPKRVSIVVPVCNEAGNIAPLAGAVADALPETDYELIFVDDGSDDRTFEQIEREVGRGRGAVGISLSRNFGHQHALAAGLQYARGEVVVMMDGDMQHPPSLLPTLIEKWREGFNVVQTKREDADLTPLMKRATSRLFYRLYSALCGIRMDPGMADFRLLDRTIIDELNRMHEGQLFLRGLVAWMGYRRAVVPFRVARRHAGRSKYTVRKMLRFAKSGLFSFSSIPLRIGIVLGVLMGLLSLAEIVFVVVAYLRGQTIAGWASNMFVMSLMFAVLFLLLGLQGEYILRIYERVQARPSFLIERVVRKDPPAEADGQKEASK